jgi:hypothetical protein
MNRVRHLLAATFVGAIGASGLPVSARAQAAPPAVQTPAPELKSVLAGRKFTPPIRGQADVDYVKSATRREGTTLITRITVKNMSASPIPRLTIDETWYDKNNNLIPGGKGVINGLLQPGEVQTIEIRTAVNPNMQSSQLMFSHANGTVKPRAVKSLEAPKDTAAKKK